MERIGPQGGKGGNDDGNWDGNEDQDEKGDEDSNRGGNGGGDENGEEGEGERKIGNLALRSHLVPVPIFVPVPVPVLVHCRFLLPVPEARLSPWCVSGIFRVRVNINKALSLLCSLSAT